MARILVIDDEPDVRNVMRRALEREGHDVDEAEHGYMAVKSHRETPASVMVVDIIMPAKEGLATIMELRRDFPEVKIIAISGGGGGSASDYLSTAKTLGAHMVMAKPFTPKQLTEAVNELLKT